MPAEAKGKTADTANDAETRRYRRALDALVEKLKEDRYILAAVLMGSLSYDQVWEKSDIDLLLVRDDGKKRDDDYCLVEDGIFIHASVVPRSLLKRSLDTQLQGSFGHSAFSKGTLLFSRDPSIGTWFENHQKVGTRDRQYQSLSVACGTVACLAKAEKWYKVKKDYHYSFVWILYAVNNLAQIEVLSRGEVPTREVIQQALAHDPNFFGEVYTRLIDAKKTPARIKKALDRINAYLDERAETLFAPIIDYLKEEGEIRSNTEIEEHFRQAVRGANLTMAYEWLSQRGLIEQVSTPLRLTPKSRVTVEEAAFYYDADDPDW